MSQWAAPASLMSSRRRRWKSWQRSRPSAAPTPRRSRRPAIGCSSFCPAAIGRRFTPSRRASMTAGSLLILSPSEIARLLAYGDYVDAVEAAVVAAAKGAAVAPPASALHLRQGSFHSKGAALLGSGAIAAITLNGHFPGNPASNGLPPVQGITYLAYGAT